MKIFVLVITCAFVGAHESHEKHYYPVTYNNLGCWKNFEITSREEDEHFDTSYINRTNAIIKCAQVAFENGDDVFALKDGGSCGSSSEARENYRSNGEGSYCNSEGTGGSLASQVYEINSISKVALVDLGCWEDAANRAIPTLERLDPILDGNYYGRADAIAKCVQAAYRRGYHTIGLQHNGWCGGSRDAEETYKKYGSADVCLPSGKGGLAANQVYHIHVERTTIF